MVQKASMFYITEGRLYLLLVITRALQTPGQVTLLQHAQQLAACLGILAGPSTTTMLTGGCHMPLHNCCSRYNVADDGATWCLVTDAQVSHSAS